jgi:hypothetical protein
MIYYLGLQATRMIPRTAGVLIALASVDTRSSVELYLRLQLLYKLCKCLVQFMGVWRI